MQRLSIGDFSRITHLSIKTLRRYHEAGLLKPAEVDDRTGYRYYRTAQVPTAQVIRRFRELGMPVREVAEVLGNADPAARNALIADHLDRLERQLEQTRARCRHSADYWIRHRQASTSSYASPRRSARPPSPKSSTCTMC